MKDLRCLKYDADGKIFYKLHFDDEFKLLPQTMKSQIIEEPKRLHNDRLRITSKKWKHLQELKSVLSKESYDFYDSIPHEGEPVDESVELQTKIEDKLKLVKSSTNKKSIRKVPIKKVSKKTVKPVK